MRAAAETDPASRLVIEMLARTGLRVGELCELTADAVAFISGRHWLRVPIGSFTTTGISHCTQRWLSSSTSTKRTAMTISTG